MKARVIAQEKGFYRVWLYQNTNELITKLAKISGSLRYNSKTSLDMPVVGDYVVLRDNDEQIATITKIENRKTKLSRVSVESDKSEQLLAANIDIVFIVSSLNNDFSERRIERYLSIAYEGGATPVLILNKSDLCNAIEIAEFEKRVKAVSSKVEMIFVSAKNKSGLNEILKFLQKDITAVFIGSSGVGKTTIINLLTDQNLKTAEIREFDGTGRHATTSRVLYVLPNGAAVIDSPGLREVQILEKEDALDLVFDDIFEIARFCKFSNCRHQNEPNCAVKKALDNGEISNARYESFVKLNNEILSRESYLKTKTSDKPTISAIAAGKRTKSQSKKK